MKTIRRILLILVTAAAMAGLLNKFGSFILLWQEDDLSGIQRDAGCAYYAYIPNENTARLQLPLFLKEDGTLLPDPPLFVNEDRISEIKNNGGGKYIVQANNSLYFSSTDGSQAEDIGHEYTVITPRIIRVRFLGVLAAAALLLWAAELLFFRKDFKEDLVTVLTVLEILLVAALLLPWNLNKPCCPLLRRNIAFYSLLILIGGLLHLLLKKPLSAAVRVLILLTAAVSTVYYFVPEWNYFGIRHDSFDYLDAHTASSYRTAGYPVFLELALGRDSDGLRSLRDPNVQQSLVETEDFLYDGTVSDPYGLMRAVRAQKLLLGAAFLLCIGIMACSGSPLIVLFGTQWILCKGLLGTYNSYVMTECFAQAVLLFAAAAFIGVMRKRCPVYFLLAALLSGYAVLIRPTCLVSALLLAVGTVRLWIGSGKKEKAACAAGILLFCVFLLLPGLEITRAYGKFLWMPSSGYVETGRLLPFADAEDLASLPTERARNFLERALGMRAEFLNNGKTPAQNDYICEIEMPLVEEAGLDRIEGSWLLKEVYPVLMKNHFSDFVSDYFRTFREGLERSRLTPLWAALLCLLTGFIMIRERGGRCGLTLMLLHCGHFLLSMTNQPERRYIYMTEIFFIIGAAFIFQELLVTIEPKNDGFADRAR